MTGRIPHPYPAGAAIEWIERTATLVEQGYLQQFAITLAETDVLIGCLSLRRETAEDPEVEIAYWLGKEYWGQGYMVEAAIAALTRAATTVGLNSVWASVLPENLRSIRVLEKIGLTYEENFTARQGTSGGQIALLRYRMKFSQPG